MQIRIEGRDLPGRACAPGPNFPGYSNIHVGVPRRGRKAELLDLQPADAPTVSWTIEATVKGPGDLLGPYIHFGPGNRTIYLSWGTVDDRGTFALFRAAKLLIADIDPAVLQAAEQSGLLIGRLGLTDSRGNPVCARVRPPLIAWSAGHPVP